MPPLNPHDITRLLESVADGDRTALDELFPIVYAELRRVADGLVRSERADATLQPTALVHEAWLRFADQDRLGARHRDEFFGAAATVMRRILVDHARARKRAKRGGGWKAQPLDDVVDRLEENAGDLDRVGDSLDLLAQVDPRKAHLVELRFFAGLDMEAAARALRLSRRQAERDWTMARAWLRSRLGASV